MLYCRAVGTGPGASVNATQVFGRNSSKTFSFEKKNQIAGQWQRSTMYHLSSRYKPHDKPIRDLLSCGRGQQTVSFSTKPRFGRKQSKSFGIRRGQVSLQFKYISKQFPYIYSTIVLLFTFINL